jgi:hypothetical protein
LLQTNYNGGNFNNLTQDLRTFADDDSSYEDVMKAGDIIASPVLSGGKVCLGVFEIVSFRATSSKQSSFTLSLSDYNANPSSFLILH